MDGSAFQSILDSAEQAASSGDYQSAESLLREAARLQAASLGPHHLDLASTFNNLGVVCERANKLADAGQFYQQALTIASASLDPEDPLVITSRNNLNDFRRVHGAVDEAPSQNIDTAAAVREHASETTAAPTHAEVFTTAPTSPAVPRAALVAGAVMAVVMLGALGIWLTRTSSRPGTGQETLSAPGRNEVSVSPSPSVSSAANNPSELAETNTPAGAPGRSTEEAPTTTVVPTPTGEDLRVVEASLCQSLSITGGRWECEPASDAAAGGSLYFYTRISSPTSVRIHHRWYRNDRVRQDVNLAVQANPSAGYRTFSRQRVDAGEWRVEVITADGAVLREERIEILKDP
jgi:tetratricopeptide (TPR) repeat protein